MNQNQKMKHLKPQNNLPGQNEIEDQNKYLHIMPSENHHTMTHKFFKVFNTILVTSVQYFYHT